jgi:hypothetical protein
VRGLAKKLGLAAVSLVSTAVAVELVFRWIDPPPPVPSCLRIAGVAREEHCLFNDYHPILGFDGKRSFRGSWGVPATQNALGFRGPEIEPENRAGRRRIVFLGDSQTWGFGLRDEETIPAAVESVLDRAAGADRFETVNLGLSGYGPDQSFLRYLIEGRPLHAEAVVFVLFPNDLSEVQADHAWNVPKPRFHFAPDGTLCLANVPPERLPGWESNQILASDPFWARSATLRYLMGVEWPPTVLGLLDRPDLASISDEVSCIEAGPGVPADPIDLTTTLLERLAAVLARERRELFVAFVPMRFAFEGIASQPYYQEIQRRLRKAGIATIEFRRSLWDWSRRHPDDPAFDESGHLRAAPIRDVVAPAIATALLRGERAPDAHRAALSAAPRETGAMRDLRRGPAGDPDRRDAR